MAFHYYYKSIWIQRGLITWSDYFAVNKKMLELLNNEDQISGIYANACGPDSRDYWRKPNIGMIDEAIKDFNIDVKRSILIGDRLSDLIAGLRTSAQK